MRLTRFLTINKLATYTLFGAFFTIFLSLSYANETLQNNLVRVESLPFNASTKLGGRVVSLNTAKVSSKLFAEVISGHLHVGKRVNKGDLLLVLEHENILSEMAILYTEIESAKERLYQAEVNYSRAVLIGESSKIVVDGNQRASDNIKHDETFEVFQLFVDENNQTSLDEYIEETNYYTQYVLAQNRLKILESRLKQIQKMLSNAHVKAPFSGVIIEKHVSVGDVLKQGDRLFDIANLDQLQILLEVPEHMLGLLRKNKTYQAHLSLNRQMVVTLKQIYPHANRSNNTVPVVFDLPVRTKVSIGSYVYIDVPENFDNKKILVIPQNAVLWSGALPSVYTLDGEGNFVLKYLRLTPFSQTKYGVLSGLHEGDMVLKNPTLLRR